MNLAELERRVRQLEARAARPPVQLTAELAAALAPYLRAADASALYRTEAQEAAAIALALADYLLSADAAATYLTIADAAATYRTLAQESAAIAAALVPYLTSADAASTYLTIATAASTYLTIANAASTYLTQANAAATYLTQANAAATYLTIANAASTYLTQANAASTYAAITQESWIGYSYGSGWGDYGTPWQSGAYMKDTLGFVHLRGLVKRTSGSDTTILTLPSGYRPAAQKIFGVYGDAGAGRIDITTAGVVLYTSGGTGYLSLEGITFDTRS